MRHSRDDEYHGQRECGQRAPITQRQNGCTAEPRLDGRWYNPAYRATMKDCSNTAIGVWSENNLDRSVVVAVHGQPG